MSLEAKIEQLTLAIVELTKKLSAAPENIQDAPRHQIDPKEVEVDNRIASEEVEALEPAPSPKVVPAMPVPPTFEATVPTSRADAVPFTDGKGLVAYIMEVYKELGVEKGALIQNVLNDMGYQNINDVPVEKFGVLFTGVEKLRNSP